MPYQALIEKIVVSARRRITSQRLQSAGARAFYENAGYLIDAVLTEFYAPGDNKVIYCKSL